MSAGAEYISKPVDSEVFTVTFWVRQSESGAIGTPHEYVGFRAASRAARRWMDRHPDFYYSMERKREPFAAARGIYQNEPDRLCMTGGHDDFYVARGAGGPLDAPEYIAAGSVEGFHSDDGAFEKWVPSIHSRGFWL